MENTTESLFFHDYDDAATTTAVQTPCSSAASPTHKSSHGSGNGKASGNGSMTTNLRRFCGMGNAAVGGLIEFGAKYGRSFDDPYDEFEDRRFFDSRDYRCCCSIFHAKIGTFIFCTLILHEIVLGTIYLLTQVENFETNANRMIALLTCRLLQFPPMTLLYVALWRHQRWLLLPFAISQLTLGAFTDISTFMMILEQLEAADSWILFDGELKWLNVVLPLIVYMLLAIGLMWVLHKCFIFLHARRKHDAQRKADKQREHELLLRATALRGDFSIADDTGEKIPMPMLPDEVMIVTTEKPSADPRSESGEDTSISSEQARASQCHQFINSSTRGITGGHLQNRHSSCQFNYYPRYNANGHLRMGSADAPLINAAMSALVLSKVQGDENSGGVRSSTLPPRPPSALLAAIRKRSLTRTITSAAAQQLSMQQQSQQHKRRHLISEAAADPLKRTSADAEFTALMLQHRNPRSSHLRGFRGSAYSLQDYLKFHINVEKANSATPTMTAVAATVTTAAVTAGTLENSTSETNARPISVSSSTTADQNPSSSCTSSTQSLTLVESPPAVNCEESGALMPGSEVAAASSSGSSSNAIHFIVAASENSTSTCNGNAGEETPTPITMRNPFTTSINSQLIDNEITPTGELNSEFYR